MSRIGPLQPPDLVDLLLDLQGLEVVKLWLVTLERAIHIVLPTARQARLLALKFVNIVLITILRALRLRLLRRFV